MTSWKVAATACAATVLLLPDLAAALTNAVCTLCMDGRVDGLAGEGLDQEE